jgi:hypothetical protein
MLSRTKLKLSPARGVGIIFQGDKTAQALLQNILQREISPRDIGCKIDAVSGAIKERGSSHTYGTRYVVTIKLTHHLNDGVNNCKRIQGVSGALPALRQLAPSVDKTRSNLGSTDVNSACVHGGPV